MSSCANATRWTLVIRSKRQAFDAIKTNESWDHHTKHRVIVEPIIQVHVKYLGAWAIVEAAT